MEAVAQSHGITKADILNPEEGNMSTRVAIAEARIINETKAYLAKVGLSAQSTNIVLDTYNLLAFFFICIYIYIYLGRYKVGRVDS